MPIHFDPYFSEEDCDFDSRASCGALYPEFDAMATSQWEEVSCKRCLKIKERLDGEFKATEKHIVDQMGDMADFMKEQQEKEEKEKQCAKIKADTT